MAPGPSFHAGPCLCLPGDEVIELCGAKQLCLGAQKLVVLMDFNGGFTIQNGDRMMFDCGLMGLF